MPLSEIITLSEIPLGLPLQSLVSQPQAGAQ